MLILGIDGSMMRPGVAVSSQGRIVFSETGSRGGSSARDILRLAMKGLERTSASLGDVDVFFATTGPGSFTGIRAGLATAYGLSDACGAEVAGAGSLECLARVAPLEHERVIITSKARKGMVYAAMYHLKDGALKPEEGPRETPVLSLAEFPADPLILFGEGFSEDLEKIREKAGREVILVDLERSAAEGAVLIANDRWERAEDFGPPPMPEYIGVPQAELKKRTPV